MKQRKHRRTFPRTNIFVWHSICWGYLAQYLLSLPFWQKSRGACHFGRSISLAVAIMTADYIG